MKRALVLVITLLALFIPWVSAEVFFGPVGSLYNVGDDLMVNATIVSGTASNDYALIHLSCPSGGIDIYRTPLYLQAHEQKLVNLVLHLDPIVIGDLRGACVLQGSYAGSKSVSQQFTISSDIAVSVHVEGTPAEPGQTVFVRGTAQKINGQTLEGFVDIKVPDLQVTVGAPVHLGIFNASFVVPLKAAAKEYAIFVSAYEQDSRGNMSNRGNVQATLPVAQVIDHLALAFSSMNVLPGTPLTYSPLVYDQSDQVMSKELAITVYFPDQQIYTKRLVKSGQAYDLPLPGNATPGYWSIEATLGTTHISKSFFVERVENVSVVLENQTLIITNIGNVPYTKLIEITIGDEKKVTEINLAVGEVRKLPLHAPNGSYRIKFFDGSSAQEVGTTHLTGDAVGLGNEGLQAGSSWKLWIWILVLVVLGVFAFLWYRRVAKKNYYGKTPSSIAIAQPMSDKLPTGNKEHIAVVAVKIKNLRELLSTSSEALAVITKIVDKAKEAKAYVYEQGEYKTIMFVPKRLGEEAYMQAALFAKGAQEMLDEHNKKHALKISYGIGINLGEMIIEWQDQKPKFTSVGTTTVAAKRAADMASDSLTMTESFHRKVAVTVKGERIAGKDLWTITRIIQRDGHTAFIDKFMKRQKK